MVGFKIPFDKNLFLRPKCVVSELFPADSEPKSEF